MLWEHRRVTLNPVWEIEVEVRRIKKKKMNRHWSEETKRSNTF